MLQTILIKLGLKKQVSQPCKINLTTSKRDMKNLNNHIYSNNDNYQERLLFQLMDFNATNSVNFTSFQLSDMVVNKGLK